MDLNKRTQKQVASRLKGNLDYYSRPSLMRTLRGWLYLFSIIAGLAAVPAYYKLKGPETAFNPGPISRAHAPFASDCASCHPQAAQIKARSNIVGDIIKEPYWKRLDQACQTCHTGFFIHQPDQIAEDTPTLTGAAETLSCSACHREHLTASKMTDPGEATCTACHNRADLMEASAAISRKFPPTSYPGPKNDGYIYFNKSRPGNGYTQVFAKFDEGHPVFQIHEMQLKDPNPMRFNHFRHHQSDIPQVDGKVLMNDCAYCHKSDGRGNFQRLTFEKSCRACHAIKFDPNTPGLEIPHGRPEQVREFLRALDIRYLELFAKTEGPARGRELAGQAYQLLIRTYGPTPQEVGPRLEAQVFYNGVAPSAGNNPLARSLNTNERAQFTGCAYCHTMSPARYVSNATATPQVSKTVIPDRWLIHGEFNHSKHEMQKCSECHTTIPKSRETSDINIPEQKSCTECHNSGPKGVKNDCNSCHHYHLPDHKTAMNAPKLAGVTTREMMLGK